MTTELRNDVGELSINIESRARRSLDIGCNELTS
jgi:hypothetical protein